MFNGSPDSAVPAIFLRVATAERRLATISGSSQAARTYILTLAIYRARWRHVAIFVKCRRPPPRSLLRISAGGNYYFLQFEQVAETSPRGNQPWQGNCQTSCRIFSNQGKFGLFPRFRRVLC